MITLLRRLIAALSGRGGSAGAGTRIVLPRPRPCPAPVAVLQSASRPVGGDELRARHLLLQALGKGR